MFFQIIRSGAMVTFPCKRGQTQRFRALCTVSKDFIRLPPGRLANAFSAIQRTSVYNDTCGPFVDDKSFPGSAIVLRWPALAMSALENWLTPGARVLDVGCGSGSLTAVAALLVGESGKSVGLDRDNAVTDQAIQCIVDALGLRDSPQSPLLQSLIVMPVDGTLDWNAASPYQAIHVGFSLPSLECDAAKMLLQQLRPGGRMVVPLGEAEEQSLIAVTRGRSGIADEIEVVDPCGMHFPVDAVESGVVLEKGSEEEEEAHRRLDEQRSEVKAKLEEWKTNFMDQHGRKPGRADLASDEKALALFAKFSKLNR